MRNASIRAKHFSLLSQSSDLPTVKLQLRCPRDVHVKAYMQHAKRIIDATQIILEDYSLSFLSGHQKSLHECQVVSIIFIWRRISHEFARLLEDRCLCKINDSLMFAPMVRNRIFERFWSLWWCDHEFLHAFMACVDARRWECR